MYRFMAALAAFTLSAAASAQTIVSPGFAQISPATQQVQLLAPQLVAFSGSSGNFDSLVTGLVTGAPVTLAAVAADGSLQRVTFVPGTTLSAADTARVLETARQSLIARGIAAPTGQQIAASLMGGTVATPSGSSTIIGTLSGTITPPTPVQIRTERAPLQSGTAAVSNLSPAQLQAVRNTLAGGTGAATQTAGGRLSDAEANQVLQLAAAQLAQLGILNPTAEQLRAALFGGTVLAANGNSVIVQGVVQPEVRNTSDSRVLNTSASPSVNISASPALNASGSSSFGTSNTPAPVTPTIGQAPASATSGAGAPAPGRFGAGPGASRSAGR